MKKVTIVLIVLASVWLVNSSYAKGPNPATMTSLKNNMLYGHLYKDGDCAGIQNKL